MLDRFVYKLMPLILLATLVAVLLPRTSGPLLHWISQWYYGQ